MARGAESRSKQRYRAVPRLHELELAHMDECERVHAMYQPPLALGSYCQGYFIFPLPMSLKVFSLLSAASQVRW
jgi:hypothetical protein